MRVSGLQSSKRHLQSGESSPWDLSKWISKGAAAEQALDADGCTHDRLNSKIQSRNVVVKDLVTDLSDGVCHSPLLLMVRKLNKILVCR